MAADLVRLDDADAGGEEDKGEQVQRGVGAGAGDLVLGCAGGLEDQDGLGEGEDAEGLEERVG